MTKTLLLIASLMLASWSALAQPVQINQATVAASGVNRSTGGFPYVITQPGSYQLSGNLVVPAGIDGIDISADNVSIDLNGFTISGPVVCTGVGNTLSCTPSGNEHVIAPAGISNPSYQTNLAVRNGTIRGFNTGVSLSGNANIVEAVQAFSNSGVGILVSDGIVRHSTANNNVNGIDCSDCVVTDSTASYNQQVGIFGATATVMQNIAATNGSYGLLLAGGVFGSNTFEGNTNGGPFVTGISTVGSLSQKNNFCGANINGVIVC
jgi:hypothetical protein